MRKSAIGIALLILSTAAAALADNAPVVFTKSGLEEAALPWRYVDTPIKPVDTKRVRWHLGWVEIKSPIGAFRLIYLPIMPPLHYNYPSPDWNEMPNAFVLTGMQIPQKPPKEEPPKTEIEVKKEQ